MGNHGQPRRIVDSQRLRCPCKGRICLGNPGGLRYRPPCPTIASVPDYVDLPPLPPEVQQAAELLSPRKLDPATAFEPDPAPVEVPVTPNPAPPVPVEPPAPVPVAPVEPPPPPAPAPIPVAAPSSDDLLARLAERMAPTAPAAPTSAPAPDPEVALSLDAVEYLAKSGRAPADAPQQYRNYLSAQAQYQSRWEQENPGEEFDINDSAHEKFVQSKYPRALRPELVEAAEREVLIDRKAEEKVAALRRELREEQQMAVANQRAHQMATTAASELEKAVGDDPVAKHFAQRSSATAVAATREATLLLSGAVRPDAQNPTHQYILGLLGQSEGAISSQNVTDQSGRRVVSRDEFSRIPPHLQPGYVPLAGAPDVVNRLIVGQLAEQAKREAAALAPLFAPKAPPAAPLPIAPPVGSPAPLPSTPSTPAAPVAAPNIRKFFF